MEVFVDSNKLIESDLTQQAKNLKAKRLEMEKEIQKEKAKTGGVSDISENERQTQNEQISQKRRKDGMDTIAKLLQETQQELVASQKKNRTLEISIRYLQNRLIQNNLNSDVELEDEHVFIPGPSKEIMDSLVKENSRLRSLTRNLGDLEEIHHLRQSVKYHEDLAGNLHVENAKLKDQLSYSKNDLKTLEKEKNEVISDLERTIEQLEKNNKEHKFLQSTMNDESTSLRKQLSDVAATCQQMALKMEANAKKEQEASDLKNSSALELGVQNNAEIAHIMDENKQLKASVTNLHEMNQRWKVYNDQREEYVHKLQVELQAAKTSRMEEDTKKKFEAILIASRQKLESTVSEKAQLEMEFRRLEEEMTTLQEAFSAQGEELRRSTQQLEHLSTHGTPSGHDIDALKAQIQICTEDFESERKDREKAQERLTQAEQDNQNLRRQINQLQREVQQYASVVNNHARPQFQSMNIPSNNTKQPNFNRDPMLYNIGSEHMRLNARGGRTLQPQIGGLIGQDVHDNTGSVMEDGATSALVSRGTGTSKKEDKKSPSLTPRKLIEEIGLLQCPKCRKEYEAHQHNELLEHIDICC